MLNENTGICNACIKGVHENCPVVLGRGEHGPVFCTCYCTGNTSMGNILFKGQVPPEVTKEFPEFPDTGI